MVVGLPDKAVGESRERVRAALTAMGLALPPKRIIVNLAPADLAKEGSHFDLPIALGLLAAMGVLPGDETEHYVALGELALDGSLLPVAGVLPAAVGALAQGRGLICPAASGGAAARHPAAARSGRGARGQHDPFGRRALTRRRADPAAALPRPASFGLARSTGRRRLTRQARRAVARAFGRTVPRRVAGIPARESRSPASADRDRPRRG